MGSRYYFSIRYVPDYADNEMLAGRCISNMHGFLSHKRNKPFKNSVGICFPVWNEQTVGNVITFVSANERILTGLSYQPYFSRMVNENLFEISDIKAVPDDAEEVRFVFNKTIQKIFNGSKKRRIKRAMKRAQEFGHVFTPISVEEREFELFHGVTVNSQSSENEFVLHIQRQYPVVAEIKQHFNGYGFASNQQWRGTVPLIAF